MKYLRKLIRNYAYYTRSDLIHYNNGKQFIECEELYNIGCKNLKLVELYQLATIVKSTKGNIVEVGAGESTRLICRYKGGRKFYSFDTYEGLPETKNIDRKFKEGQFKRNYHEFKILESVYKNTKIIKGLFEKKFKSQKIKSIGLCVIDVDLYESTKYAIEQIFPLMETGGIILSHDWNHIGVKTAIEQYLYDKPATVIELLGHYVMIIKNANKQVRPKIRYE